VDFFAGQVESSRWGSAIVRHANEKPVRPALSVEESRAMEAEMDKTRLGRFRKWYRHARGRGGPPIEPKLIREAGAGSPWIVRATMHMFKVSIMLAQPRPVNCLIECGFFCSSGPESGWDGRLPRTRWHAGADASEADLPPSSSAPATQLSFFQIWATAFLTPFGRTFFRTQRRNGANESVAQAVIIAVSCACPGRSVPSATSPLTTTPSRSSSSSGRSRRSCR